MSGWIWLAPVASFLGAGLAYVGAWLGTRQRESQGRREEWGRRFTAALQAINSDDLRSRMLGRTLLAELAKSELASAEERSCLIPCSPRKPVSIRTAPICAWSWPAQN